MRFRCFPAAVAVALCAAGPAHAALIAPGQVSLLGVTTIPFATTFGGTPVGGLSGIDYNPATNQYIAISDDRSQNAPARFYQLQVPLGASGIGTVSVTGVTTFTTPAGTTYPATSVDPESIRFAPGGGVTWSSEGDATQLIGTSVMQATAGGRTTATLTPPAYYAPTANNTSGIRNNLAFEGLTYTPDGSLYAALENSLNQDGPNASLTTGSANRVLRLDPNTGAALAEYVYLTDPIPFAPVPANGSANNGVSEFLAIDDTHFLALERAFSQGVGNSVRIYEADLPGATNVLGLTSLAGAAYQPLAKSLVADLSTFGFAPDNVEGITFGPNLPNGDRTLVLIVDNNFAPSQTQQVIALEIAATPVPEPAPLLLLGSALAILGLFRQQARA